MADPSPSLRFQTKERPVRVFAVLTFNTLIAMVFFLALDGLSRMGWPVHGPAILSVTVVFLALLAANLWLFKRPALGGILHFAGFGVAYPPLAGVLGVAGYRAFGGTETTPLIYAAVVMTALVALSLIEAVSFNRFDDMADKMRKDGRLRRDPAGHDALDVYAQWSAGAQTTVPWLVWHVALDRAFLVLAVVLAPVAYIFGITGQGLGPDGKAPLVFLTTFVFLAWIFRPLLTNQFIWWRFVRHRKGALS